MSGFFAGCAFTLIGPFDTYADVVFCAKLFKCAPITWISFHIFGQKYVWSLPFGLDILQIAIFALVFGVFICQAFLGLSVFLCRCGSLSMACKLNEFNLVLAVMESELETLSPDDESYMEMTPSPPP